MHVFISAKILMTKEHKKSLQNNRDAVIQNITLERVLDILYGDEVLTDDDLATIQSGAAPRDKVGRFLDALRKKNDDAFQLFINALEETSQSALAALFEQRAGIHSIRFP